MKIIITLSIILSHLSCNLQNENVSINGNWYNFNPENTKNLSYVETYYDGEIYYLYKNESGLNIGAGYHIEKNKMWLDIDENSKDDVIILSLKKNILKMYFGENIQKLKKISNSNYTLEKYLNKEITENQFLEYGFWKRKKSWEENGYVDSGSN